MKDLIFILLILFPLFSESQDQVILKSGKIINVKVDSFLGENLILSKHIESLGTDKINVSEVTQLNGETPEYRKKAILKKNSAVIFNEKLAVSEIISKEQSQTTSFSSKFSVPDSIDAKVIRIALNSGKMIKTKKIIIDENKVSFTSFNYDTREFLPGSYNLNEIKSIKAATKTAVVPGFLVGTGIGTVSMLIINKLVTKDIHTHTSTGSSETWYDYEKSMTTRGKITIVAGGALLGTLTGLLIKTGWKTVVPRNVSFLNKVDFDIYNNPADYPTTSLLLDIKF
jgi:hypothetical protein